MRREKFAFVLLVALTLALASPPARGFDVKMATLSPEGSPWDTIFKTMGNEWQQETGGRVSLLLYPGRQAGDEPDIIRKMRIGQYHGAMLTVSGLTDIDDYFSVFEIPFFFRSYAEVGHVLRELTPVLKKRLEEKDFVHLGWGYVGWVHVFTTEQVETVDDLRRLKIFTWAGNDRMIQWLKRNGFQPVALAATDIITGLQTGLIEAVPMPPLYAMQLQYFRQTPHMMDLGFAPMMGAMLITKRAWNRIDEADRVKMRQAAARAEKKLIENIPKLDETAVNMMSTQGLSVTRVSESEHLQEWLKAAEGFAEESRRNGVPQEVFDLAIQSRDAFRQRQATGGESR